MLVLLQSVSLGFACFKNSKISLHNSDPGQITDNSYEIRGCALLTEIFILYIIIYNITIYLVKMRCNSIGDKI